MCRWERGGSAGVGVSVGFRCGRQCRELGCRRLCGRQCWCRRWCQGWCQGWCLAGGPKLGGKGCCRTTAKLGAGQIRQEELLPSVGGRRGRLNWGGEGLLPSHPTPSSFTPAKQLGVVMRRSS
eukprot:145885-Chlamydomonas_euryale.AAC.1